MEKVILNNGVEMPVIGFGVFQVSNEETARCVKDAISVGYRLIDTAQAYYNEDGVGEGIKQSGIDRGELFITTKVWVSNAGEERAAKSIDESLRKLQTDYIDLLLVHQHYGDYYGTWRAMEKALKAGKVRAIGVSNLPADRFVDLAENNEVKPAMHQVRCNVFFQQRETEKVAAEYGTKLTAWGPLGQGAEGFHTNPTLMKIAAEHGKSVAQVGLRWLVQRGIVAIPKSTHIERMRQNINVFDFSLTDADMQAIAQIGDPANDSNFDWWRTPDAVRMFLSYDKMYNPNYK